MDKILIKDGKVIIFENEDVKYEYFSDDIRRLDAIHPGLCDLRPVLDHAGKADKYSDRPQIPFCPPRRQ